MSLQDFEGDKDSIAELIERGEAMMSEIKQDYMNAAAGVFFEHHPDDEFMLGVEGLICPHCLNDGREDNSRVFVVLTHTDGDMLINSLACEAGHEYDVVERAK